MAGVLRWAGLASTYRRSSASPRSSARSVLLGSGCRYFDWGANAHGQLGDGTTSNRLVPGSVPPATPWSSVEPGNDFGCGIRSGSELWCWGSGGFGNLGNGMNQTQSLPVQVTQPPSWASATAGGEHACGITTAGNLFCWGAGSRGQIGDGNGATVSQPLLSSLLTGWTIVERGEPAHVRDPRGRVVVLGRELRRSGRRRQHDRPALTDAHRDRDGLDDRAAAGDAHSCGIRAGGSSGAGATTSTGNSATERRPIALLPTRIGTGTNWLSLATGADHTCGTRAGGQLWCWGQNFSGEVGDGTTTERHAPIRVGTGTDWNSVTAGQEHSCGTRAGGQLWCWGDNFFGQFGDGGALATSSVPVRTGTGTDWTVAAGRLHTCGIRTHGDLFCWGANNAGQTGDGSGPIGPFAQFRTTPVHTGVPTDWDAISAGGDHTCGVSQDKSLWCWGQNGNGQIGDGTTTDRPSPVRISPFNDWTDVAAGDFHTCAIEQNAFLRCWGWNFSGQLGDGTTTDRLTPVGIGDVQTHGFFISVTAGRNNTCATTSNNSASTSGALWCWGYNAFGQVGDGTRFDRHSPVPVGRRVELEQRGAR